MGKDQVLLKWKLITISDDAGVFPQGITNKTTYTYWSREYLHGAHQHIRGEQKNKKSEFHLAEKLPPFSLLSWFQKYKNQLWTPTGIAASEKSLLSSGLLKVKI